MKAINNIKKLKDFSMLENKFEDFAKEMWDDPSFKASLEALAKK